MPHVAKPRYQIGGAGPLQVDDALNILKIAIRSLSSPKNEPYCSRCKRWRKAPSASTKHVAKRQAMRCLQELCTTGTAIRLPQISTLISRSSVCKLVVRFLWHASWCAGCCHTGRTRQPGQRALLLFVHRLLCGTYVPLNSFACSMAVCRVLR